MTMKMSIYALMLCMSVAALVAVIMVNRLKTAIRKLQVVNKEITWLVYLAVGVPLLLAAQLIPMNITLFLIVWTVLAFPVSFHFNRKYSIWLDAKLKDKKRQENLEKMMEMQMKEGR